MISSDSSARFGAEIVRRIREGEETAETELVSRYRPRVAHQIRLATRDRSSVDDIHQDTFQLALEKIRRGDLREPEKLSRFLRALARNLVISHHRETAAHPSEEADENLAKADPSPDALETLLSVERAQMVRRLLDALPSDRDREILFRFYIAEEDKDAICRDLSLSSLAFNRVLHRARERYRLLYESTQGAPRAADDELDHELPSWLR
jgi:RNA polymerase sigma-70 factor (ECF subfamily)